MDIKKQLSLTSLLDIVRQIDYNFSVKETPFSVKISIKKTKIKYHENTDLVENHATEKNCECNEFEKIKALEIENGAYISQLSKQNNLLAELKTKVENLLTENKSLEKSSKSFEQQTIVLSLNLEKKRNECEILQKSLNAQNDKIYKLNEDLNKSVKTVRMKEKEIHDNLKKNDTLEETCKKRKEAIAELKKEIKDLRRELKKLNKVNETTTQGSSTKGSSITTSSTHSPLTADVSSTTSTNVSPALSPPLEYSLTDILSPQKTL